MFSGWLASLLEIEKCSDSSEEIPQAAVRANGIQRAVVDEFEDARTVLG